MKGYKLRFRTEEDEGTISGTARLAGLVSKCALSSYERYSPVPLLLIVDRDTVVVISDKKL